MTVQAKPQERKKYVRAVGPRLRRLLYGVLGAFALMALNSVYLGSVTFTEWWTGKTFQDYFYLWMFLGHLIVGLAMIVPVILFGVFHIRNAHNRPNRRARPCNPNASVLTVATCRGSPGKFRYSTIDYS